MKEYDFTEINLDLATISNWLQEQGLTLNNDKVKCMLESRKSSFPPAQICIGAKRIEQVLQSLGSYYLQGPHFENSH